MFREHNVTRNSIREIRRNYSTNSSDSFSTKTTHLVEKPYKKAGPLKRTQKNRPAYRYRKVITR